MDDVENVKDVEDVGVGGGSKVIESRHKLQSSHKRFLKVILVIPTYILYTLVLIHLFLSLKHKKSV